MKPHKVMLLFGPPGTGKGTQGKALGAIPGLVHLATGDMFRGLDPRSPLGQRVRGYSSRGELVPDDLTVELWQDHVEQMARGGRYRPGRDLLVLDGIPRSPAQAAMLDPHVEVLVIVQLIVPDLEELVQRMKQRALKEKRQDDADERVIRRRFEVYGQETAPTLSHYPASLVRAIPATGAPLEVLRRILDAMAPVYSVNFANPMS
jgi:adenylate kinase